MISETDYRKVIQETLARIEKAFGSVDPDLAECEQAFGALTITLSDRSRCILSSQPSVRQLWLALASEGVAYHFDLKGVSGDLKNPDLASSRWIDDKRPDIELFSFLSQYLTRKTGRSFEF